MIIVINVDGQMAKVRKWGKCKPELAPYQQKFVEIMFDLSTDWNGLKTFAQFRQAGIDSPINVYLSDKNSVRVPSEIMPGTFTIMLYGADADRVATTNAVRLDMPDNYYDHDATGSSLTPSLYQQLIASFDEHLSHISISGGESANLEDVIARSSAGEFLHNCHVDEYHDDTTDTQYQVIRIYKTKLDGTQQYPFVVAPNGSGPGTQSTKAMNTERGYKIAINSGIFDMSTGKPDGVVIQNKAIIQDQVTKTHIANRPLTIDSNGDLGYTEYDVSAADMVASGIVSAVCGFMPIIVNYEKFPKSKWNSVNHYTAGAQRQIIGQYGNGDYCIITSEGRDFDSSVGWTIAQAQDICVHLGLKFAYNLDGGGSTETMILKRQSNIIYEGDAGRVVPTFIVFTGTNELSGVAQGTATYTLTSVILEMSATEGIEGYSTSRYISSVTATYTGSDGSTHTGRAYGYTVSPDTLALGANTVQVTYKGVKSNAVTVTAKEKPVETYTKLSYISTGGVAWLDTGVVPTSKTSAEYQYMITTTPTVKTQPHVLSSDADFFPTVRWSGDCFAHRGGTERLSDDGKYGHFVLNKLYTVSAWRDGSSATINDGEIKFTGFAYGSTPSTTNLLLGHYYADSKYNLFGNVYYLKIYESDTLIRDFVPAIRDSDGAVGMLDKVGNSFYTSASGTAFMAGPTAQSS